MSNDQLLKELRQRLHLLAQRPPARGGHRFRQLKDFLEEEWTEGLTPPCGLHEEREDDEAVGRAMMESIEEDCSWYGQGEDIQNTYQSAVEGAYKDQADAADTMLIAVCGYSIESLRSIVRGKKQDKE